MHVIPITPPQAAVNPCAEETGTVHRLNLPLARRELLKGSGILIGTITAGSVLAALAPTLVWAVELKALNQAQGQTLMAMGRVLYPHKKLPDAVYALLAKDLDAKAASDPTTAAMLKEGIAALNRAGFQKADAKRRLAIVKSIEGKPFFNAVRSQCVTSLYDNDMAFAAFGYPGASWNKGGYITRGFQDLKWLPEPTTEQSPPPFLGG